MKIFRVALSMLLVGLVTVAMVGASRADDFLAPSYLRSIGRPGHASLYPWGAATAKNGTILIGDYWNYRVARFSTAGKLLQRFGGPMGSGPGQNEAPHGLAVDPNDGAIYVSDLNDGEIDKFDASGKYLFSFDSYISGVTWPIAYTPRMAVNSEGLVYVVNSHSLPPGFFLHRIVVFDQNGNYQFSFGTNGTADGELGLLRGMDLGPDDEVYVADTDKKVIQVFDASGNFLRKFGGPGTDPGQFGYDMRGVVVDDDDGWVYVVDAAQSQIEKFDLEGNHLKTFGSEGVGNGQFRDGGREITIGPDNNVYAPDFANYRVNVYSPEGVFLRSFPTPPGAPPKGGFNLPQGVAVNPSGTRVYVADTYNHRIQMFGGGGAFLKTWGFRGSTDPYAFNYPRGIAVDPSNGDVWVNNTREGNVKYYTSTGSYLGSWIAEGVAPEDYSRGIWVGEDGRVFVTDTASRRVVVADKFGVTQIRPRCGSVSGLLSGCTGVATDSSGNFYAASVTNGTVNKYAPDGTLLLTFGTEGAADGQLAEPYDVEVYQDRLYVSESGNSRISVFSLDGVFIGRFGTKGQRYGQFRQPRSISIDEFGRLYIVDQLRERVLVYQIR